MKTNNNTNTTPHLPQFISKLIRLDEQYKDIFNVMKILYAVLIIAHIAYISIAIYKSTPYTEWINHLGTLLSFSVIFFVIHKGLKELKNLDYSQPIYQVAKSMKKRHSFISSDNLWLFVGLIMLGISIGLNSSIDFLLVQLMFWTAMFIGLLIGYIYWYKQVKPLRDKLSQIIKELEE